MPKPRLDRLKKENERLHLMAENARLASFVNSAVTGGGGSRGGSGSGPVRYDILKPSSQPYRRQPLVETLGEDRLMARYNRNRATALCRDLERNFTSAKAALNQFRINVVGIGPKMRLHTTDTEINEFVSDWVNARWMKQCDFRGDDHYADQLSNAIASIKREGNFVSIFDDDLIEDSGKLLYFEADQLVEIEDLEANGGPWARFAQESGVLFDKLGRDVAYAVTFHHGRASCTMDDASIFPKGLARLIRRAWRFNQKLGIPDLLTSAADLQDLYEGRAKELQTMKVLAERAGVIKKKDANSKYEMQNERNADGSPAAEQKTNYDRLEALTGGRLEYMEPDDEFTPLDFDRPSVNYAQAFDFILRSAGSALGLSKTYTTLNTEASYTAFRGDLLLSWSQFYVDQKFLERRKCDIDAIHAINWGLRTGALVLPGNKPMPAGWDRDISWKWPEQPAVDPLKEAQAAVIRLGNLLSTMGDEIGPDWKKNIDAARQLIEEAGDDVPVMFFNGATNGAAQEAARKSAEDTEGANGDDESKSNGLEKWTK